MNAIGPNNFFDTDRKSIMRSRVSQMSFDLGDLRSYRKPMRCVIGN